MFTQTLESLFMLTMGLLFASDASGTWTIANPIGLVLDRFDVTIDGS